MWPLISPMVLCCHVCCMKLDIRMNHTDPDIAVLHLRYNSWMLWLASFTCHDNVPVDRIVRNFLPTSSMVFIISIPIPWLRLTWLFRDMATRPWSLCQTFISTNQGISYNPVLLQFLITVTSFAWLILRIVESWQKLLSDSNICDTPYHRLSVSQNSNYKLKL